MPNRQAILTTQPQTALHFHYTLARNRFGP
jgi:hypothetical protein